ncbi:MAG: restriction endonuclease subunit S [Planctomycetota bacterium]|nr:MAG: restriction endonuclease subunit S [Planctomycetota bacterium]
MILIVRRAILIVNIQWLAWESEPTSWSDLDSACASCGRSKAIPRRASRRPANSTAPTSVESNGVSRIIFPGTLLLTNSGATLGVPKITHIQGCINDGVAAFLRMRPGVIHEYLYYYWSSQTKHLHAWVNLGAQPNLNTQIIGGWPVLLPTCDEQQQIADFLTSELAQIAFSSRRLSDEISLMQEYRTRLIADIVTGKLDVRESAAALPDDLEAVESDAEELLDSDETTDDAELDAEPEEIEA